MPLSPARRIAFDVLLRVHTADAFAGDLLHSSLGPRIRREDAALCTELTYGCLRWQRLLDTILTPRVRKPLDAMDLEVVLALRMGLYQLRFLDRIPPSAAVNESVQLARRAGRASAAGLVNAVLRGLADGAKLPADSFVPADASLATRLGLTHSHPDWLVSRWLRNFGEHRTRALLASNNAPAAVACAVHTDSGSPEDIQTVISELASDICQVNSGRWLKHSLRLRSGNVSRSAAFRQGRIHIQDEASQMVPLLLDARPGESVLELCAGQGGKTLQLLAHTRECSIISADLHWRNLAALRRRAAWRPASAASSLELVALDAARPLPFSRKFQKILVDAPCSGTGTLARNPEIRWRLSETQLSGQPDRQLAILRQAARCLAPGGRLVYATCSLEPEENEELIGHFLHLDSGFRTVHPGSALAPHLLEDASPEQLISHDGAFRTFPPESLTDGFFAVALEQPSRR